MQGEKITINCEYCGQPFTMSRAIAEKRGSKFCSVACAAEKRSLNAQASRPAWTCENCGIQFQRKYERSYPARFCSQRCQGAAKTGAARPDARPLLKINCKVCGTEIETRAPDKRYCSRECQNKRKRGPKEQKQCETCLKTFVPRHAGSRYCSRNCLYQSMTGENAANWKGGKYIDAEGYVRLYVKGYAGADGLGYIKEHRYVMEQILGRPLRSNENVHHINGDKADNRPENLELWVRSQPAGQRAENLVKWAREIIFWYGKLFPE